MSRAGFYDLNGGAAARALPVLLERILVGGMKAVVRLAGGEALKEMNRALWTWGGRQGAGFLPHAAAEDGVEAKLQPVWLTCEAENPNGAQVLVVMGEAEPFAAATFSRCLFMFDSAQAGEREKALAQYQAWRKTGEADWHRAGAEGWQKLDPESTPGIIVQTEKDNEPHG